MILVIAEKPSLASKIQDAIGNMKREDGYYINESYIITYAFGHLFTLMDIEDYLGIKDTRWTLDTIPFYPKKFQFELIKDKNKQVDKGVLKQFNIIKKLINLENVDTVVNAGDSEREGEIIIRIIIDHALMSKKTLTRLWLPDQTKETILDGLNNMKLESEYDNLANEGYARTFIDWLYGINLTRYATLKTGSLLRVGRVIVPIVKAIYDRDMEIKNFKPSIYYIISSLIEKDGITLELNSKEKFSDKELKEANILADKYNKCLAKVIDKKEKESVLKPSKLFSLSKLQSHLGEKYKMTMKRSLAIVQNLYENGYLTYPRTSSEYMSSAEKGKVKQILNNIKNIGYDVIFKDTSMVFNDKKIESHSAITPTTKIPNKKDLTEDEYIVYQSVFKRFVSVFCRKDCVVLKTEVKISVDDLEEFIINGNIIKEKGFLVYDEAKEKEKFIPNLNIGDTFNVSFKPKEKKTTPPKHYTTSTLNSYLINPFKDDKKELKEEDDSEDYKAIFEGLELGTVATRTQIIENAIKSEYINLKNDVYTILPNGIFLIESLIDMGISMDKYKTSELGKALKKVYRNEISIDDIVNLTKEEIDSIFKHQHDLKDNGFYKDVVGICPKCGENVIKSKYNYCCSNYKKCDFKVNLKVCGHSISKKNINDLLTNGITDTIDDFISKNGKFFNGKLKLIDNKVLFDFN